MHSFLPPTIFKNSHTSVSTLPKIPAPNTIPPPPLPPSQPHQQGIIPPAPGPSPQPMNEPTNSLPNRRLRRARSLSNLFGMANPRNGHIGVTPSNPPPQIVQGPTIPNLAVGRPHVHSVTGVDIHRSTPQHSDIVTTMATSARCKASNPVSRLGPTPYLDSRQVRRGRDCKSSPLGLRSQSQNRIRKWTRPS